MLIVDRFEGDYAVIENGEGVFINIDRKLLKGIKEGDVIVLSSDCVYRVDKEATKKRKKDVEKSVLGLWK